MKIGDKITICGKDFYARCKYEAEDYLGNLDVEVELVAADGEKRWFPEWLCNNQVEKEKSHISGSRKTKEL